MSSISQFPASDDDGLEDAGWFSPGGDAGGLNLRFLLGALRRRKFMIAGVMLAITGTATIFVSRLTPLYSAEALIVRGGLLAAFPLALVAAGVVDRDALKRLRARAAARGAPPPSEPGELE